MVRTLRRCCDRNWTGGNKLFTSQIDTEIECLQADRPKEHHVSRFREHDRGDGGPTGGEYPGESYATLQDPAVSCLE